MTEKIPFFDPAYMRRCIELALKGAGQVAPNPMVGAVLVHEGVIIGEGYHRQYGQAHAEVNCINQAIENGYSEQLSQSTIYVSLEPCAHFGKTPPCADLIIRHRIPGVVIGSRDPFEKVNGKGIQKLEAAGVLVEAGVLEQDCYELNKRFFVFHTKHKPYVILKWAQTADGFIASTAMPGEQAPRLLISNEYANRLVHKWRSEEAAILVGTNTAMHDDPALTTRLWPGSSPTRLVVDMKLKLPASLQIFNGEARTIIFNTVRHSEEGNLLYYQVTDDVSLVHQILNALYHLNIQSVIVEGGARLLQSFIDEQAWDEARIITNTELEAVKGLPAPNLTRARKTEEKILASDKIEIYQSTTSDDDR